MQRRRYLKVCFSGSCISEVCNGLDLEPSYSNNHKNLDGRMEIAFVLWALAHQQTAKKQLADAPDCTCSTTESLPTRDGLRRKRRLLTHLRDQGPEW
jgi:hypothetical protein